MALISDARDHGCIRQGLIVYLFCSPGARIKGIIPGARPCSRTLSGNTKSTGGHSAGIAIKIKRSALILAVKLAVRLASHNMSTCLRKGRRTLSWLKILATSLKMAI